MKSKRATKKTRHSYSLHRNEMQANTHEIPNINFARRLAHAGPVSVIPVPFASSVICVVTQLQGMTLDAIKVKRRVCSRIRGTAIA